MHLHYNPDPIIAVRLPPGPLADVLTALPPRTPASELLGRFAPHPTGRRGVTAMVLSTHASDFAEALADLDAAIDDAVESSSPTVGSLFTVAYELSRVLGSPIAGVKARMSALHTSLPYAAGSKLATSTYAEVAEASSRCATALRTLEDAQVIPELWSSTRGVLARAGIALGRRHAGIPGFALMVPPLPTHLIPPPVVLGGSADHVTTALRALPLLARLEVVANRTGGPAAAARNWVCDFFATCLIGADATPTGAAEARSVVARCWAEVVVPAAEALHRVQEDTTRS